MSRRTVAIAVLVLALGRGPAYGEPTEVDPDRPSVANSARTVPPRAVQLETGFEYSRTSTAGTPRERRFVVDALARIGVLDRLEVDLDIEPIVRLRGAEDDTGVGDLTLGLKYRAFDAPEGTAWPTLGVQPFVKLPTADEPIGSGRPDFGVIGLASFALPAGLALDVNAGVAAIGQGRPSGYLVQALVATALAWEIGAAAPFVEVFYASRDERDGRDAVSVDVGIVYKVTKRLALDAAIETTLAGRGPDWAMRAGLSVRFGK